MDVNCCVSLELFPRYDVVVGSVSVEKFRFFVMFQLYEIVVIDVGKYLCV